MLLIMFCCKRDVEPAFEMRRRPCRTVPGLQRSLLKSGKVEVEYELHPRTDCRQSLQGQRQHALPWFAELVVKSLTLQSGNRVGKSGRLCTVAPRNP